MIRKLIYITTFIVLLAGFIAYEGWHLFKPNGGIKAIILSKVRSAIGQAGAIDSVDVGLGSVKLQGVRFAFQDSPYEVEIDQVTLGYSFTSILKGAIKPEEFAEEITVLNPQLILRYNSQKKSETDLNFSLDLTEDQAKVYSSLIKEYDFIKRITIKEGKIIALDTVTSEQILIAKQISGWVSTNNDGQAWIRMAGHIFGTDEYNMIMYGQFDLKRGGLDKINIDLHDYNIGNEIPFFLPEYLDVKKGRVNGQLTITERLEPTRGFNIEGEVSLEDGEVKLASENLYFTEINIDAEIKNWNLEIKSSSQKINGSPTKLEGRIHNLLDPQFDLRLTSSQLNLDQFLDKFSPDLDLPLHGITQIDVSITESLHSPRVKGTVTASHLRFFDKEIGEIEVALDYREKFLSFPLISGKLLGGSLNGQGSLDYSNPERPLNFVANLNGDFTEDLRRLGLTSVNNCMGKAHIEILGTQKNPVSTGNFELIFTDEKRESLVLDGMLNFRESDLSLSAASTETGLEINATVKNLWNRPVFDFETIHLEHVFAFINDPVLNFIKKRYNVNLKAEGSQEDLAVVLEGSRSDTYEKIFVLKANKNPGEKNRLTGSVTLFPNAANRTEGDFELDFKDNRVELSNLRVGDWLDGDLILPESNSDPRHGKFLISGFKLSSLLALLGEDTENYEGDIYGRFSIDGTSLSPEYSADLWLLDGIFGKIRPVKGALTFKTDADNFILRRLNLEDSQSFTFTAQGNYNFKSQNLQANLAGTNVDLNELISLLTGRKDIIEGNAVVQVSLDGQLPQVPLYGKINVHKAKILDFAFDEVVLDFGNEENSNGSYFSKNAFFSGNTTLAKQDEFILRGTSLIPLKAGIPLDVQLAGDGNFLAVLPDLVTQLFEETQSEGHLDLKLAGGYTSPNFTGSQLSFKNGLIKMSSVAKKIENIEGELAVTPDDYFLDVTKLRGTIRGEEFSITTTNDLFSVNHGIYEPLRIGGDDLSLGAIILKTSAKGVPVHIPGVMENGEIGWFNLVGKNHGHGAVKRGEEKEERFFIAGPWERPRMRGKIYLQNVNVMWPFDEGSGEPNPTVQNIIDNMDWDVVAVAKNDTHYEKRFPSLYVNMEVGKGDSLAFRGVLKDSTFSIAGKIESQRGQIEYFDQNFRVEKIGAEFNRSSLYPYVYGRAWTSLRDSTLNTPQDIYMTLYTIDDLTHQEVKQGRYDRVNIKLSSQVGSFEETQKEVMAALGFSSDTMKERARTAVGSSTDNLLFRPLFRPVERQLERKLGLDVVRFSYSIARNFIDSNFSNEQLNSALSFLRSSRLVLGKYLTENIYILYTGELQTDINYQLVTEKGVGFQHIFGLEYRLNPRWLLQMEYDYNTLLQLDKDDKKVWLRHSFPF